MINGITKEKPEEALRCLYKVSVGCQVHFGIVAHLDRATAFIHKMRKGALMWNIENIVKKGDYDYAIVRDHPNASKYGYVLAHRVIMENHLGRLLDKSEVVHHLDGNKHNNDISNLEVLTANQHTKEHHRLHGRKYARILCPNCLREVDVPENYLPKYKGTELIFCSRRCNGQFHYRKKHGLLTHQQEIAVSENIRRYFVNHHV